jgi:UDP-glucose 4-epimerase
MTARKSQKGGVIALFGSAGPVGRALLLRLAADPKYKRIVCFDLLAPRRDFPQVAFYKTDLADPNAGPALARILEKENVDTVVHAAGTDSPISDADYLHEYEGIATLQILAACAFAKVKKLVVQGTTAVYGAHPKHPVYLSEEQPPRVDPSYAYLREKIDVERQVADFTKRHPETKVSLLRLATLMGRGADNFMVRYLNRSVVPTVLGHDPLWQVLHIDDALDAFFTVLEKDIPGIFNYAAPGVLPLSKLIRSLDGVRLPLPYSFFKTQAAVLQLTQMGTLPPQHIDFLRYSCLADCTRAFKLLGLRPKNSIQDTLAVCCEPTGWWEDDIPAV